MQFAPILVVPVICGCASSELNPAVPLSRRDLPKLAAWKSLDLDGSGIPIVWLNTYRCDCGDTWDMAWSCQCGDRCPLCDAECDAAESEWIGPEGWQALWETQRALPEDVPLPVNEPIRCGWSGQEANLIAGADSQDGMQSDCLCPACQSDHYLSGFDAAVNPL